MAVYTANFAVSWKPAGAWVDITSHIKEVSGDLEFSGNIANALSFGDQSRLECTIETQNLSLQATAYLDIPIRVQFTIGSSTDYIFWGVISGRDRTQENLTFRCEGFARLVNRTRIYSPAFFRRLAATKTTISSIDNPGAVGYAAGLINYALWKAGGRPAEQDFLYPDAKFYYSCEDAILAPEWSWLAGENAWEECLKLAQAVGGQLYQATNGVIYYKQPLSFGDGTALYTFDEDVYGDLTEKGSGDLTITKVVCPYIPRTAQSIRNVIEDSTQRLVSASRIAFDIILEPQNPIKSLQLTGGRPPADAIKATFLDGTPVKSTDYTIPIERMRIFAGQITLPIKNTSGKPFVINKIVLRGEPIVAGEAGTVTSGSGSSTLNLQDNPYIQSQLHAQRISDMQLAFHATTLPIRTASGCVHDPDRYLGETVNLTCSRWGLASVRHLITAIRHSDTGSTSDYDLCLVEGLPRLSDFFIIGNTNWSLQSKKLSF